MSVAAREVTPTPSRTFVFCLMLECVFYSAPGKVKYVVHHSRARSPPPPQMRCHRTSMPSADHHHQHRRHDDIQLPSAAWLWELAIWLHMGVDVAHERLASINHPDQLPGPRRGPRTHVRPARLARGGPGYDCGGRPWRRPRPQQAGAGGAVTTGPSKRPTGGLTARPSVTTQPLANLGGRQRSGANSGAGPKARRIRQHSGRQDRQQGNRPHERRRGTRGLPQSRRVQSHRARPGRQ